MGPDEKQIQRTAKGYVRRWFTETPLGHAFLPGDGLALPIGASEAVTIRTEAESTVADTLRQVHRRVMRHVVTVVLVFMGVTVWSGGLPSPWRDVVHAAAFLLYGIHGVLVAHAFWKWERSVFALRDAIALSLRGRVPLPSQVAGPLASREPDYRLLGTIVFILMAILFLAETAPGWLRGTVQTQAALGASHVVQASAVTGIAVIVLYVLGTTALRRLADAAARRSARR